MKIARQIVLGGVCSLLALSAPATAKDCWNGKALTAAKVRDLQTVLMVGALQCRNSAYDVLGSYNKFVKTHRLAIGAHNDVLKSHFKLSGNARDYDKFTTALANGRSAGTVDPNFCRETAALADKLNSADKAEVESIADKFVVTPKGVGRTCS